MPTRREHVRFERPLLEALQRVFGRRVIKRTSYPEVHLAKDLAWPLLGPKHRRVGHDLGSNIVLGAAYKDLGAVISGILHDYLDLTGGRGSSRSRSPSPPYAPGGTTSPRGRPKRT